MPRYTQPRKTWKYSKDFKIKAVKFSYQEGFRLNKFAQMLLNKGQLNGKRILSKQAVKMMSTNEIGHLFDFLNNKWGYLMSVQESTNTAYNLESDFLGGVACFGWIGFWGTKFITNNLGDQEGQPAD